MSVYLVDNDFLIPPYDSGGAQAAFPSILPPFPHGQMSQNGIRPLQNIEIEYGTILDADGTKRVGYFSNGMLVEGKIVFPNGTIWEGQFEEGLLSGQGKMILSSGRIYEGQFEKGCLNGIGKLTFWTDRKKQVWSGQFEMGEFKRGSITFQDGRVYQGQFKNGSLYGIGQKIFPGKGQYKGWFEDDLLNGQGIAELSDGSVYKGQFKKGMREGEGEWVFSNGTIYRGQFKQGYMDGFGVMTFSDGSIYEGQFEKGKREGEGEWAFPNGTLYRGQFKQGDMNGFGVLTLPNGSVYRGNFKMNQKHGKGVFKSKDGGVYEGSFQRDLMDGFGSLQYPDGSRYIGQFREGRKHGWGRTIWTDGETFTGSIKDDRWDGFVSTTLADGRTYIRQFKNGVIISDISNMKESLFHQLVIGDPRAITHSAYSLGIMSKFLMKDPRWALFGIQLAFTRDCIFESSVDPKMCAKQVLQQLQAGKTVTLASIADFHAVGISLYKKGDSTIVCQIHNSGEGLQYHAFDPIKNKYQTTRIFEISSEECSEEYIEKILVGPESIEELYQHISCGRLDKCSASPDLVWQTAQKGLNCSLEWIFAYLKQVMPQEQYLEMRKCLFDQCRLASLDAGNGKISEELQRKRDKRSAKLEEINSE